ncbi:IclR family transcriptional regulator [Planobispora longispora]|uniref:Glycerol operon regulatory protein n=1 Tax=Planobispora longispora TaxID=28887 RepID=A0A8J3RPL1_9ACTN|nr:IclR family transcriptional regulator [Planobispora longispora]GIH77592.1 IclR family transcriptional regulator [Planobispora longispora]
MGGGEAGRAADRASVQSVDRAIEILEILARRGQTGVTELAQALGVHKSTAFRLLASLERRGLVEQRGERGAYRLGFGVVRLAGAATAQLDLAGESREICRRLAAELGETVNIAVLEGGHVINISQVRGPAAITGYNWVGQRTPVHATSSGKVLLAYRDSAGHAPQAAPAGSPGRLGHAAPADPAGLAAYGPLERYTPDTVVSPARLAAELAEIRKRGYGFTTEELEVGLNAVAAPIRGHDGSVVAAVSASGPSYRLTPARIPEVGAILSAGAGEISERIGFSGPL